MADDPKLPWKAAAAKKGDYLVLPGDEVAEVITIPEVKPGKVPVAWATVRESVHKSRIGQTLIVSLFSIVEGAPKPGQVQLKKSLAEVVVVKPVEVKDLTKLSPIDYALWVESDGRITQDMRDLAGKYEDFSDKKLVSLLEERGLSQAGISYAHDGEPANYVKSKGLFLKLQRPSIIARIAYHEAKGREKPPVKRPIEEKKEAKPEREGVKPEAKAEPKPEPEPTAHYGPPDTASAEVKIQWNRMLGEIRRQYPLDEPVLTNEAKRLGVTHKEMQLIIANERWGQRK